MMNKFKRKIYLYAFRSILFLIFKGLIISCNFGNNNVNITNVSLDAQSTFDTTHHKLENSDTTKVE